MDRSDLIFTVTTVVLTFNIILALMIILFERRKPSTSLTWLLVLFFMPIIGFILYLFVGQDMHKKKIFFLKADEEELMFEQIRLKLTKLLQERIADDSMQVYKDHIQLNMNTSLSILTQDNSIQTYYSGPDFFSALFERIEAAQHFIHIQSYIIRGDKLGRSLIDLLAKKAAQGVEVKLLSDSMGTMGVSPGFFLPLLEAGGKTAIFFKTRIPWFNLRVNYRNHRKISIIDGIYGFVGGFNIGDEYHEITKKYGFWRDTHLQIHGSAVKQLEIRFLQDWRFAAHEELDLSNLSYFPLYTFPGNTAVQVVSSGPDSHRKGVYSAYVKMINNAKERLYLQTPYLVPDESALEALRLSALSGVDVRIMIPANADHPLVHEAASYYVGELLASGARIFSYEKGFLHSKMMVMDGHLSSVGSANMDIRSFELNFECNAFIYDTTIGHQIEEQFIKDIEDCTEITLEIYGNRSLWMRFKESVCRLISPLL